ncbi:pyridine nucleotide-disulfide oxidoreductase [Ralstonia solanacearum]|uniref:NAD(P)/FAD-dependent oxidoreductase n=1 Tax=Ralstonia solanacearum TaxID=305 RepID=UPI000E6607FB|nr:FAD-dependent oxidoreductase [Ralstonia solanacearum]RIJ87929.1 pyridine nucleotide-disulfide oxidoreductase [Ralstonia solanacearum]
MHPADRPAMVIVGAGHVGGRAALALREAGWQGPIALIGEEPHAPYERPPLSKGVLTGAQSAHDCRIGPPDIYAAQAIDTRLHSRVERIDRAARAVVLADGRRLAYARLLLATGGQARALAMPGAQWRGVQPLRTLDDAQRLREQLRPGARVVVIGGGFIGLEVAASARALGCAVCVVERGPRLLGRAVPAALAERVDALHRRHGVEIRLAATPVALHAVPGTDAVGAVELAGGERLPCDTVVVGIGIVPNVALAQAAGLAVDNGIVVDATLRTADAAIYAAGDVCAFPAVLSGRSMRQETWRNAEDQARTAAANMLGAGLRFDALPSFWSDQYDHTLQVCGEPAWAERTVSRALGAGATLDFHLHADGRLVGASGFGQGEAVARDLKLARLLIEQGARPDPGRLADPACKLKALLSRAPQPATELEAAP